MRTLRTLAISTLFVVASSCGGPPAPEEPAGTVGETESAAQVCPLLVPFCPEGCRLVGHCPQRCECPPAFTACGDTYCTPNEMCCCPGACRLDGAGNFCAHKSEFGCPI